MKKFNWAPTVAGIFVAAVPICAWILFNWQALNSLHQRWLRFDEPYAVGYPAVLLSLWWIWRHRRPLGQRVSAPSIIMVALLGIVLLIGAAALLVQLMLLQQLVAIASLWLIFTALLGWGVGRLLIFPTALVALGIPIWDFLVDPMRAMTVWFTQHMLDMLNIPAHIDGFFINLPAGTIEVAGGCSGLNLFLAMILVGLMFAESHHVPRMRRISIVLLAGLVGIIDNWVRVFALVVIAHVSRMQSGLVYHHGSFGWWIFAASLLPYFWLATRIEHRGTHAPVTNSNAVISPLFFGRVIVARAIIMSAMMLCIVGATSHLEERRGLAAQGFATPSNATPADIATIWLPHYSGQDVTQAWHVRSTETLFDVVVLTYIEQRVDKKLIYFSNRIADEDAIRVTETMKIAPGFSVNSTLIYESGWRQVWWFWWVDGAISTSPFKTKLLQLRAMLAGDPSGALVAVSTRCPDITCKQTRTRVQHDVVQLLSELRHLQQLSKPAR